MKPLRGPFPLTHDVVAGEVAARFGVFALGYTSPDGRFCTTTVGRADGNLRERLARHIGAEREFKYVSLPSMIEGFDAECRLFHSLAPLKTRSHPARPSGSNLSCPVCGGSSSAREIGTAAPNHAGRVTH
jgi:hypothetical protein